MNSNGEQLVIIIIKLYVWKCDTHVCAVRILDGWMDARERETQQTATANFCARAKTHLFYYALLCTRKHTDDSVLFYTISGG